MIDTIEYELLDIQPDIDFDGTVWKGETKQASDDYDDLDGEPID